MLPSRLPQTATGRQLTPYFPGENRPEWPEKPAYRTCLGGGEARQAAFRRLTSLINDLALRTSWTYAL